MKKVEKYLASIDFTKHPSLRFLKRLTNDTGVIQHAKYAVPDRNLGYSVDDNARALIVAVLFYKLFGEEEALDLAINYLSYIQHSKSSDDWFYNFMTYDHKFLNEAKTEDGFGRVFWALGYTVFAAPRRDLVLGARHTIGEIAGNVRKLKALRAKAYTMLGLYYLALVEGYEWAKTEIDELGKQLLEAYKRSSDNEWKWFEPFLTYANGLFPYALVQAFQVTKNQEYLKVAREALEFLESETTDSQGTPIPIGQDGWYFKGKDKAIYDQQPIEAAKMILANLALFKAVGEIIYFENALKWMSWYFGNNTKKVEVYDPVTGGCFDGINSDGVNLNQGAESIITYLLAYLAFSDIELKS